MLNRKRYKIHSIIHKSFSRRKGFTYIEVIIATTILAILAIPMSGSFYQAVQNQRFALDYYIGYLHSQNIADDLSDILSNGFDAETLDQYFDDGIQQYDLEHYTYHIYVSTLHGESLLYFQAGEAAAPIPFTGISYAAFRAESAANPKLIIDDSDVTENPVVRYQDGSLYVSESLGADYNLDLEIINTDKTIPIYNHSSFPVFIQMFSGSIEPQTPNIFVYHSEKPKPGYVVTVDAYRADKPIKRFLRFV